MEKKTLPLRTETIMYKGQGAVVVRADDVIAIMKHLEPEEFEKFHHSLGYYIVRQILTDFTDAFEEEDNDGNERVA